MLKLDYQSPNRFGPSRATVMSHYGMVAASQPLASLHALDVLREGGNAIDAVVTAAILLSVLEPMSTGLGGDLFAIVHDAGTKSTHVLNATGRAPVAAEIGRYRKLLVQGRSAQKIPLHHILSVTVPGAVDGWRALLERFGTVSLSDALRPAIRLAREGFPVAPHTAAFWVQGAALLAGDEGSRAIWLKDACRAPQAGEVFRIPALAETLHRLGASDGEDFYNGKIADAIVSFIRAQGGLLTKEDLSQHRSDWVEPVSATYRGYELAVPPPNGQGLIALQTLKLLEKEPLSSLGHNTAATVHIQVEAIKRAFEHAWKILGSSEGADTAVRQMLSNATIRDLRRHAIDAEAANSGRRGSPKQGDTVYVAASDSSGNFASLINSIFTPWGSGLTVPGTAVLLQNRGHAFSLDPDHVNALGPRKRPRHTIVPALLLKEGRPVMAFGFVGGDAQVQCQVQFLCNLVDFELGLQEAMDAPRWRYDEADRSVALEPPLMGGLAEELRVMGHKIAGSQGFFGGGQAVLRHPGYRTLHGASDSRRDGCALGF
jgi:gamma-glutamyltranspeptidase/glutathione hydrolase